MNKLWLIVKREYLTRIRKKSFILATILVPLGIALIAVVSGYFASGSMQSQKKVLVVDQSGILSEEKLNSRLLTYTLSNDDISSLKNTYSEKGYDILIDVPKLSSLKETSLTTSFYSAEKPSLVTLERIEDRIANIFSEYKIEQSDIDQQTLDELEMKISLENGNIGEDTSTSVGDSSSKLSIAISSGLSYMMGFLMYIVIFVYGGMVMRSVMEEKINRIVEVMISSVKPFQLMLGKVMGVGLVGLTQLGIWLVILPIIVVVVSQLYGVDTSMNAAEAQEILNEVEASTANSQFAELIAEVKALNWMLILPTFVIFFLGGYFIYSSLFAAVGSAVGDDLGESQQLMMPILIPVIIAFVMVPAVFNDPDGPVAIFGSMFPLFSPIIMPARLPFDPPLWQVLVSIVILIASVIFMVWVSGRIYRIGILMYGKKVSLKEIGKWLFYKG